LSAATVGPIKLLSWVCQVGSVPRNQGISNNGTNGRVGKNGTISVLGLGLRLGV